VKQRPHQGGQHLPDCVIRLLPAIHGRVLHRLLPVTEPALVVERLINIRLVYSSPRLQEQQLVVRDSGCMIRTQRKGG